MYNQVLQISNYFLELALLSSEVSLLEPSRVAAAAVLLAGDFVGFSLSSFPAFPIGYTASQLTPVCRTFVEASWQLHSNPDARHEEAVRAKYESVLDLISDHGFDFCKPRRRKGMLLRERR